MREVFNRFVLPLGAVAAVVVLAGCAGVGQASSSSLPPEASTPMVSASPEVTVPTEPRSEKQAIDDAFATAKKAYDLYRNALSRQRGGKDAYASMVTGKSKKDFDATVDVYLEKQYFLEVSVSYELLSSKAQAVGESRDVFNTVTLDICTRVARAKTVDAEGATLKEAAPGSGQKATWELSWTGTPERWMFVSTEMPSGEEGKC